MVNLAPQPIITDPLEDLANYIVVAGITNVAKVGGDLFYNYIRDGEPSKVTRMMPYVSGAPAMTFGVEGTVIEMMRIEISCRGDVTQFGEPKQRCKAIRDLLDPIVNQQIGNTYFLRVEPLDAVVPLGPDDQGRPWFAANFKIQWLP